MCLNIAVYLGFSAIGAMIPLALSYKRSSAFTELILPVNLLMMSIMVVGLNRSHWLEEGTSKTRLHVSLLWFTSSIGLIMFMASTWRISFLLRLPLCLVSSVYVVLERHFSGDDVVAANSIFLALALLGMVEANIYLQSKSQA